MNIIAVDNNRSDLLRLAEAIRIACPDGVLSCFTNTSDALEYIEIYTVHVAFLETIICNKSGFEFAKKLQKQNQRTNIIFVTNDDSYAVDSYEIAASGYAIKPITTDIIINEIKTLRYPLSGILATDIEQWFMIKTKNGEMTIPYDDIFCAVYAKGGIQYDIAYMKPQTEKILPFQFKKSVAPLLKDERFIKANKTSIVNMTYIDTITGNSFVLYSGKKIKIHRNEYAEVSKKYSDYIDRYGKDDIWD